jgi:hypothetical protein
MKAMASAILPVVVARQGLSALRGHHAHVFPTLPLPTVEECKLVLKGANGGGESDLALLLSDLDRPEGAPEFGEDPADALVAAAPAALSPFEHAQALPLRYESRDEQFAGVTTKMITDVIHRLATWALKAHSGTVYLHPQRCRLNGVDVAVPPETSFVFRRDAQIHQWATTIANPRVPLHHVAAAMHYLSADKSTDYRAVFMTMGAPLIVVTFGKRTTTQARGGGAAKSRRKN